MFAHSATANAYKSMPQSYDAVAGVVRSLGLAATLSSHQMLTEMTGAATRSPLVVNNE